MGKILIFAEKPPMAKDLAHALEDRSGKFKQNKGYFENDQYVITYGIGHLIQAKMPSDYAETGEFDGWKWNAIPFYPKGEKLEFKANPKTTDQLKIVKSIYQRKDIDIVINACDAAREGELIFWLVYHHCKSKLPVKRWFGRDLTKMGILKAFDDLKDKDFYETRKDAAYSRQFADWALGNNLTVAFTLKARENTPNAGKLTLHIGRVQTPTLAILVNRRLEIENFKPEDYFEIEAEFGNKYKGQWFRSKLSHTRFDKKEEAQIVIDKIQGKTGTVTKKEIEKKPKKHPFLYSLNSLSVEAGNKYGFSAQKTLDIAQVLYEKYKLTTYPRTDSNHLTTDFATSDLEPTIKAVNFGDYAPFATHILSKGIKTTTRFVDNSKVSDHHAIVPTKQKGNSVTFVDEKVGNTFAKASEIKNLYDMIVRRFLCVFYPDAIYEKTEIVTEVEGETFKTSGNILVSPGWKEVYGADPDGGENEGENGNEKDVTLPPIEKGEENPISKLDLKSKQTQPPKPYTEPKLLEVMENPRKFVEDKELREAMKEAEAGLGTPATRASHIEKLIDREYVTRKGKTLFPTDAAVNLITVAPENLKSPIVTAEWEQKLRWVELGKMPQEEFERGIREYVQTNIDNVKNSTLTVKFKTGFEPEGTEYICLKCKGNIIKVKYQNLDYYICENHTKENPCMRLYEKTLNRKLPKKIIHELLTNGETKEKVPKLLNKDGKPYEARIKMDLEVLRALPIIENDGKPRSQTTEVKCPFCEGKIEQNTKAFGCDSFKQKKSCGFTVWKNESQKLDIIQIKKLIDEGKTDVIDDMKGPKGKYSAYYELDIQNKKIERKYAK